MLFPAIWSSNLSSSNFAGFSNPTGLGTQDTASAVKSEQLQLHGPCHKKYYIRTYLHTYLHTYITNSTLSKV